MSVWEIVGGVGAVAALLISLISPMIKLNTAITKLTVAVEGLKEYTASNAKCHDDFSHTLGNHETRITVLEDWRKGVE